MSANDSSAAWTLPWRLRARAYATALGLTFLSVPLLHLYLHVDLSAGELLLHAADIALGTAAGLLAFELLESALQRSLDWRLDGRRGRWTIAVAAALSLAFATWHAPHDFLPGMQAVRTRHVASGYADMSLRVLPLVPLIGWLAWTVSRQALLRDELAALRALNAVLLERAARGQGRAAAPVPSRTFALRHDGGELLVDPAHLVRVQARENYCELVFDEASGRGAPLVRATLAEVVAKLPEDAFVRTHRSHVVALGAVTAVRRSGRRTAALLSNGEEVPIARARVDEVRRAATRFVATPAPG